MNEELVDKITDMLRRSRTARWNLLEAQGDFDRVGNELLELRVTTDRDEYDNAHREAEKRLRHERDA